MVGYSARRIGSALAVAWLALTLAFIALRLAPGDAVDATLRRAGASAAEIAARKAALGFDDPLPVQYAHYLAGVLRGDWGESLISGEPVLDLIAGSLGATFVLAWGALLVAVAWGVLLGVVAGLGPWRIARAAAEGMIALLLATPIYWTATLAIYLFTVVWPVLPGVGGHGPRYVILPVLVLGLHAAGGIAQVTADSVRQAADGEFVRTARAKGLPEWAVWDHILRVGLLPVAAVVALQLGFLLGGTVITETIFVRRGLGRVLLTALESRDYPVVQGIVVLAAVVYSLVNAAADVLYGVIDPRVREQDGQGRN